MKSLPCILFIQQFELTMQLTPLIAVHMTAAIGAVILGPFALWARMGSVQRPWLHRAMGYAYATLMLLAATSACLIAGGFTLLPSRYLGNLVWGEWLGWL